MSDLHSGTPPLRHFEIETDVPPAWSWDQYEAWLWKTWTDLLKTSDPSQEGPFQGFLEQHPCLVPGGEGTGRSFGGHHGGWGDLLFTQPPLPGIFKKIPDFMWLTKTSEDIIPVLIEIEAPGKPWLIKRGRSAKLNQAEGQIAEWQRALDNGEARRQFAEMYDFPARWAMEHHLEPRFLLIYGRRAEFALQPERNRERRGLRRPSVDAMTYDRLKPLYGSKNAICVRWNGSRRTAVAVPPTFRLGPGNAKDLARLDGLSDVINQSDLIGDERRRFLLARLPYWQQLGEKSLLGKGLGSHGPSDWE